jgi:hypothetical protein
VSVATAAGAINNLFKLKSINSLKKDQTNIKIFKNSSFDSNFNSVQSLNTNLSYLQLPPSPVPCAPLPTSGSPSLAYGKVAAQGTRRSSNTKNIKNILSIRDNPSYPPLPKARGGTSAAGAVATQEVQSPLSSSSPAVRESSNPLLNLPPKEASGCTAAEGSAILRAIRTIRFNRNEWKLIRFIYLMEKKIRSSPLFASPFLQRKVRQQSKLYSFSLLGMERFTNSFATQLKGDSTSYINYYFKLKKNPKEKIYKGSFGLRNKAQESQSLPCTTLALQPFRGGRCKGVASLKMGRVIKSFYIKQNNKIFSYNNNINKNILLRNMKYNFLKSTLSSILKKKIRRISEILEDKPIKNYVLYSYLKFCIFTPCSSCVATAAGATHLNVPTLSKPSPPSPKGRVAAQGTTREKGDCITPNEPLRGSFVASAAEASQVGVATQEKGVGRAKLSLNKYKGRKFGSFINYNKIIGYKFNSTFYQPYPNCLAPFAPPALASSTSPAAGASNPVRFAPTLSSKLLRQDKPFSLLDYSKGEETSLLLSKRGLEKKSRNTLAQSELVRPKGESNIYIKDTYKLLFYLFKSMYCLISKPVLKYTNDKVTIQLFYYLNIPKKKVFRLFSIFYINSIKKKWLAQIEKKKTNFIATQPSSSTSLPFTYTSPGAGARGTTAAVDPNRLETGANLLPTLKGGPFAFSPKSTRESIDPLLATPLDYQRLGDKGRIYKPRGNTKIYIRWKLRKAISRFKNKIIPLLAPKELLSLMDKSSGPLSHQRRLDHPQALGPKGTFGGLQKRQGIGGGNNLLFKLRKFNLTAKAVFQSKFKLICAILSNKFNKPVELQLIRLHHPYHDSNILVNLLSLNIKNKRKKARVAIQKIYNKKPVKNLNDPNLKKPALPTAESQDLRVKARGTGNLTPAFLSGLNIKIAGRLMGEPIIPRITRKVYANGASAIGKVNFLDVAKITKKNRKGAYTIKITSGQNFF